MKSDRFINKYIDSVNTYIKKCSINHTKMQIHILNVFKVYAQVWANCAYPILFYKYWESTTHYNWKQLSELNFLKM